MEHAAFGWQPDQRELAGTVVGVIEGRPAVVTYRVTCDAAWRTLAVRTSVDISGPPGGEPVRTLDLRVDDQQRWRLGNQEVASVRGCVDVDLGISPVTNTLPIRRLGLAVGDSREVTAAWVRYPDLHLQPLRQRYTRLAEDRYRYESPGFAAELTVDELGIVRRYGDIWVAEAVG